MKPILLIAFCISSLCSGAQYLYVPGGTVGAMTSVKIYPSGDAGPTGRPRKLEFLASGSATVIQANSDNNFIEHDVIINAEGTALNSNQLVIYRNGNVGIGTAAPQFKLQVPSNSQVAAGFTYLDNPIDVRNNYVRSNLGSNVYWNVTTGYWEVSQIGANDFSSILHPNGGGFSFITAPSTGNITRNLLNGDFMAFERMRISPTGDLGIGTSPSFRFHVRGGVHNSDQMTLGSAGQANFAVTSADGGAYGLFAGISDTGRAWMQVGRYDGNTTPYDLMLQTAGGNVGIGTTNTDAKLTVKGDIHTREVRVDVTGGTGPDYVFEKDYNLLPLAEVERYIKQNKHLPEVPSAKEMEKEGLNLKEMNLLLLKKVEELTLHLIEQNRINQEQQNINKALMKELDMIKKNK